MKNFTLKKFTLILLSIVLIVSLSACKNNKEQTGGNSGGDSKPSQTEQNSNSTPSKNKSDTSSTNSETDKTENNESVTQNPTPTPTPTPKPVKKTPKELIVGKWTATGDLAPILADEGINVDGPLEITLYTEFTTSGTLIERADEKQIHDVLIIATKQALLDEIATQNMTQAEFEAQVGMSLDECVEDAIASLEYENMFTFIAEYKFVDDVLLVKTDDTPFVETQYTFINDNTLKISTDGDETVYTRVK